MVGMASSCAGLKKNYTSRAVNRTNNDVPSRGIFVNLNFIISYCHGTILLQWFVWQRKTKND